MLDRMELRARGQPESYPASFEFDVATSCLHVVIAVEVSEASSKMAQRFDLAKERHGPMDDMVVLAVSSQSLGRSFGVAEVSAA